MRKKGKPKNKQCKRLPGHGSMSNTYTPYYWYSCEPPTEKLEDISRKKKRFMGMGTNAIYRCEIKDNITKWFVKKWIIEAKYTTDSKLAHLNTIEMTLSGI